MKDMFYKMVKENLSEVFEEEIIQDESKLIEDLGFESVTMMQLIIEAENYFGIEFYDVSFEEIETVGQMYSFIEKRVAEKGDKNSETGTGIDL